MSEYPKFVYDDDRNVVYKIIEGVDIDKESIYGEYKEFHKSMFRQTPLLAIDRAGGVFVATRQILNMVAK